GTGRDVDVKRVQCEDEYPFGRRSVGEVQSDLYLEFLWFACRLQVSLQDKLLSRLEGPSEAGRIERRKVARGPVQEITLGPPYPIGRNHVVVKPWLAIAALQLSGVVFVIHRHRSVMNDSSIVRFEFNGAYIPWSGQCRGDGKVPVNVAALG